MMWTPPARRIELSERDQSLTTALKQSFGDAVREVPHTSDMPTFQVEQSRIKDVLRFLKTEVSPRFLRLDDLTAIDESARRDRIPRQELAEALTDVGEASVSSHRAQQTSPDFSVVYHLLSFEAPSRLRLKVALTGKIPQPIRSRTSGRPPTGMNEKCSTCSGFASRAIQTFAALSCPMTGRDTPCGKAIPAGPRKCLRIRLPTLRNISLWTAVFTRKRATVKSRSCSTSAQPCQHPRPAALHCHAQRRRDHRSPPGHRLPSPGSGKNR